MRASSSSTSLACLVELLWEDPLARGAGRARTSGRRTVHGRARRPFVRPPRPGPAYRRRHSLEGGCENRRWREQAASRPRRRGSSRHRELLEQRPALHGRVPQRRRRRLLAEMPPPRRGRRSGLVAVPRGPVQGRRETIQGGLGSHGGSRVDPRRSRLVGSTVAGELAFHARRSRDL